MDDIEELENKLKTSKDNIYLYNKKNKPDKIENVATKQILEFSNVSITVSLKNKF